MENKITKIEMPSVEGFGRGTNGTRVDIGELTLWFSYKTLIAFRKLGQPRVVRENDWSTTTGGHLASIDGGDEDAKALRLSGEDFKEAFARMMAGKA